MRMTQIKENIRLMSVALDNYEKSKDGLTTYEDDSEADHGDGQQVGREAACFAMVKYCAGRIVDISTGHGAA